MKRYMCFFLSLLLSGLLVSCGGGKGFQDVMKEVDQQSTDLSAGFIDGCDSGMSTDPDQGRLYYKDLNRYETDPEYQTGWDEGFEKCK